MSKTTDEREGDKGTQTTERGRGDKGAQTTQECALILEFLGQLINFLLSLNVNIDLNLKKVLFGDPSKRAMSFENLMILYIKGFIWQCKIKNAIPTLRGFKSYLKLFLSTLKFVHTILNIENIFNQNLYIYEHLLQE